MDTKLSKITVPLVRRSGHVLLNPGPVNTSARVKGAMLHDDECHRDPQYAETVIRLRSKLHRVFQGGPEHSVVLVTGSGTAAMECGIASSVPRDGKILVIDNGAFGARLAEIAELHEMDIVHLRHEHGHEVDVDKVRELIATDPDIAVVAMCHHETSVGLLNPVRAIGALCADGAVRETGPLFLVDAVSSIGAEELDVVSDGIDVCWGSANKCLHGISGAAFLCVSDRAWARIETIRARVYYLDLARYRRYHDELSQTPFTPAVSTYYALEAACDEFLADGHAQRQRMYASRNAHLRAGLRRLGLHFFTDTGHESHSVVTASVPKDTTFAALFTALKARGFVIYDCKPPMQGAYFQVANMGELSEFDLDAFLVALADTIDGLRAGQRLVAVGA